MSSEAVIQRRNNQIQDAIDGQNFKQALQLCEKRLKKGEDTPFLRVGFVSCRPLDPTIQAKARPSKRASNANANV